MSGNTVNAVQSQQLRNFVTSVGEAEAQRLLEQLNANPADAALLARFSEHDLTAKDARKIAKEFATWKKNVQGQGKPVSTAVAPATPGATKISNQIDLANLGRLLKDLDSQIAVKDQELPKERAEAAAAQQKMTAEKPGWLKQKFSSEVAQAHKNRVAIAEKEKQDVANVESARAGLVQRRSAAVDNALSGVPEFKELQTRLAQAGEAKAPTDRAAGMVNDALAAVNRARQQALSDMQWEVIFGGRPFMWMSMGSSNSGDAISGCNAAINQVNEAVARYNRTVGEEQQLGKLQPLPKVETMEDLRQIVDFGSIMAAEHAANTYQREKSRAEEMQSQAQSLDSRAASLRSEANDLRQPTTYTDKNGRTRTRQPTAANLAVAAQKDAEASRAESDANRMRSDASSIESSARADYDRAEMLAKAARTAMAAWVMRQLGTLQGPLQERLTELNSMRQTLGGRIGDFNHQANGMREDIAHRAIEAAQQ
jgi:hypothetical protein